MDATASRFGRMQVEIINASIWIDTRRVVQAVNVIKSPAGTWLVICSSTIAIFTNWKENKFKLIQSI